MLKINGIFVTGTDTDVGKTVVSSILLSGSLGQYWKPIQSGSILGTDKEWIQSATKLTNNHFMKENYLLSQPLSPHAAGEIDNIKINLDNFEIPEVDPSKLLIVEGSGGIMVPLNENQYMIDLMKLLALPILLVSRSTLGTINHTLLSLEQLRRYQLHILGVVLNGPSNPGNRNAIEKYGGVKILAEVEPIQNLSREKLLQIYREQFSSWLENNWNDQSNSRITHLAALHANADSSITALS